MSQKRWIIIFAVIIAAMTGIYLLLTHRGGEARIAMITSEGETLQVIDLDTAKDEVIEITDSNGGTNAVRIRDGQIFVEQADCPDGICMKHGPLEKGGTPIVCLPHQLVIRWAEDSGEVDN